MINEGDFIAPEVYAVPVPHVAPVVFLFYNPNAGADPREGAHPPRAPSKIEKNMIFWRKIVIFHKKYLKNFRASLRSAQFF